jgi:hypothetical protein
MEWNAERRAWSVEPVKAERNGMEWNAEPVKAEPGRA